MDDLNAMTHLKHKMFSDVLFCADFPDLLNHHDAWVASRLGRQWFGGREYAEYSVDKLELALTLG